MSIAPFNPGRYLTPDAIPIGILQTIRGRSVKVMINDLTKTERVESKNTGIIWNIELIDRHIYSGFIKAHVETANFFF